MPGPSGEQSDDGTMGDAEDVFEDARRDRRAGSKGEESDIPPPPKSGSETGTEEGTGPDGGSEDGFEEGVEGGSEDGTPGEQGTGGKSERTADATDQTGGGDSDLDEAFEDFDGSILAERGVILGRANETAEAGAGDPAETPMQTPGEPGGAMPPSGTRAPASLPPMPDIPPAPEDRGGNETASADLPADIPDARDDAVVERQLREAAMGETDPVLREKLWEEYRRYKSGH